MVEGPREPGRQSVDFGQPLFLRHKLDQQALHQVLRIVARPGEAIGKAVQTLQMGSQ